MGQFVLTVYARLRSRLFQLVISSYQVNRQISEQKVNVCTCAVRYINLLSLFATLKIVLNPIRLQSQLCMNDAHARKSAQRGGRDVRQTALWNQSLVI